MPGKIRLLIIAGPTGSGKSGIAIEAAKRLGGEIINADSIQVYRHFTIGSAKPTPEMLEKVPHHLIDIVDPDERFSLWDYKEKARKAISDIARRGKVPILAGGTGLYIKAVLENLQGGAPSEPHTRAAIMKELECGGTLPLYERLAREAPEKAARIHPNDRHRIIRALEALAAPDAGPSESTENAYYDCRFFVLGGPREKIYARINERVEKMIAAGWIKETEKILAMGYNKNCKPFHSVGYKQVLSFLENRLPMENLISDIQMETRRYAKRQVTWFNGVKGAVCVNSFSVCSESALADYIVSVFRNEIF